MTLQYDTLMNWPLPTLRRTFAPRDTILYAIGIGASIDADDKAIDYLYEERGPATFPTMATILAQRTMWMDPPELGVEYTNIVHGEQKLTIHQPLPAQGEFASDERVTDIYDKGPGKGAVLWTEQTVRSADGATLYATLHCAYFLRGNGGFGGDPGPASSKSIIPDRAPDGSIDLPTRPDQAIIYRLMGDVYPLHIDDAFARGVGFTRPILHGLCSYGIAGRALISALCEGDATKLEHMAVRFSAPVYPGETLRTQYWRLDDGSAAFRCSVVERDLVVLNHGFARVRG